jgi:hypothetical protein
MRDPLQSQDKELLKKYDAEFQEIESLPPATIELTGKTGVSASDPYANRCGKPGSEVQPTVAKCDRSG